LTTLIKQTITIMRNTGQVTDMVIIQICMDMPGNIILLGQKWLKELFGYNFY
jgi:hypothetical protein